MASRQETYSGREAFCLPITGYLVTISPASIRDPENRKIAYSHLCMPLLDLKSNMPPHLHIIRWSGIDCINEKRGKEIN